MLAIFLISANYKSFSINGRGGIRASEAGWNLQKEMKSGTSRDWGFEAQESTAGGKIFRFGGVIRSVQDDANWKPDGKAE